VNDRKEILSSIFPNNCGRVSTVTMSKRFIYGFGQICKAQAPHDYKRDGMVVFTKLDTCHLQRGWTSVELENPILDYGWRL